MGKEDREKQKNGRSYLNIAIILKMGGGGGMNLLIVISFSANT